MKKLALIVILASVFSKSAGLLRDLFLSYFYGASSVSDAYLISTTIPSVIISFIGVGLSTGFIPAYNRIESEHGTSSANEFMNKLILFLIIIFSFIMMLVLINTEFVVNIFAKGFDSDTKVLAVNMSRIAIVSVYFIGIVHLFSGFLNIKGSFKIPVLIGIPLNIVIILSIVISKFTNIYIISIGTVIANFLQFFVLYIYSKRNGFKMYITHQIWDKNIRDLIFISIPIILGVSLSQINSIVDRTLASTISVGGISALNYANKLNLFVYSVFVISIITVMYPRMSQVSASSENKQLKKIISESIAGVSLLVLPASIGALIFSENIISLLFGRGAFDQEAIRMTSQALFYYSIGMIWVGYREVLSRAFYSFQNTSIPMINSAWGVILNIVLNIILSKYLGVGGLALATSISALFTTLLLFISLRKKIGPFGIKHIIISFLKILFASLIMGGLAKLSFHYLTTILSQNFSLLLAIGIGVLSYFVTIYFMKIEDVDVIVEMIKKKLVPFKN